VTMLKELQLMIIFRYYLDLAQLVK